VCLLRGTDWVFTCINFWLRIGLAWLRQVVTGLSPQKTGFHPRSVRVRFAVYTGALGQVFVCVLRFPPVSVIPPLLHTCPSTSTTSRTPGDAWQPPKSQCCMGDGRSVVGKVLCVWRLETLAVSDIAIALQLSNALRMEGTWQGGPF